MPRLTREITETSGSATCLRVIAIASGILAVIGLVVAAKLASSIVVPTIIAALAALTLSPAVRWLERNKLPPVIAAILVVGTALAGATAMLYILAPTAEDWRLRAPEIARSIEWELRDIKRDIEESVEAAAAMTTAGDGEQESPTEQVIDTGRRMVADALMSAPGMIGAMLYIAVLSYFLLADRARAYRGALSLCRSTRQRLMLARAVRSMREDLSGYLFVLTIINAVLGGIAAFVFWMFELPNPLLWGTMVAVLNYAPFVGPMICNIVVFCVGVVTFHDSAEALYPVLVLVTLNIIEGQIFTPMIVGNRLRVGPLFVFSAVAFGAWLWGPLGALLATPLLIAGRCIGAQFVKVSPVKQTKQARNASGVRYPKSA